MTEALITGGVAILVCMINNIYQQRIVEKKHDETIALVQYKLEQLEKKQDKHNNVIERVHNLEQKLEVGYEKVKVINHRLEDLEKE